MSQSPFPMPDAAPAEQPRGTPRHVAIIMDGNGRWATQRGLPRTEGHRVGADAVRRTVEAAARAGVGTLTLYAFSSDNWKRPQFEVATLMRLLLRYLRSETPRCLEHGIRMSLIGRRDRLPGTLRAAVAAAESATAHGRGLHLRLAVDYSARDVLLRAVGRVNGEAATLTRERFAALIDEAQGGRDPVPDIDLLIRTGGEQRLSDFLLWESAYAELCFTPVMWPDFAEADLAAAMDDFARRERRFGTVGAAGTAGTAGSEAEAAR